MDFIPSSNQLSDFQRAFLLRFYRSQFWRLQKHRLMLISAMTCFIGHNFGDYKNSSCDNICCIPVLSVTILETTKTNRATYEQVYGFYRSQFWRLQKQAGSFFLRSRSFIGHNFGDYKNFLIKRYLIGEVLSVTILETTKTSNGIS